ncbi:MAG: metal ABC transporter permease [Deltaproteobacteria bacterium]|nr:metal ABC transporter permease [Deltaproteobacteria bacterium]MBI3295299.1 metal ABC transporter permease [Deltaproteobacteria bacterium]
MSCDLIAIYKWAIAAGMVVAPALALLGCHIAARDRSVQAICISQGAMLGAIVGLFFEHWLETQWLSVPVVFAGSALAFLVGETLTHQRHASKNTLLCSIFATLLALGYLFSALFPGVENHMTQVFFGDLATLSNIQAFTAIALGCLGLGVLAIDYRNISRSSFAISVFGNDIYSSRRHSIDAFSLFSLAAMAVSVQFMGFLFTISSLFLPTSLALLMGNRGLKFHLWFCALVASAAAGVGFHLSLHYTQAPTVPLIVLCLVGLGTVGSLCLRRRLS